MFSAFQIVLITFISNNRKFIQRISCHCENQLMSVPIMTKKLLFIIIILCSGIASAQEPKEEYPRAQPLGFIMPEGYNKVTIPFDVYNNLIVIDVLLNRSLPLKFILDTGVRTAVLTEKTLTDLLNLPYSRKISIPGAGGKKFVDAFVVNNVLLMWVELRARDMHYLSLKKTFFNLKTSLE